MNCLPSQQYPVKETHRAGLTAHTTCANRTQLTEPAFELLSSEPLPELQKFLIKFLETDIWTTLSDLQSPNSHYQFHQLYGPQQIEYVINKMPPRTIRSDSFSANHHYVYSRISQRNSSAVKFRPLIMRHLSREGIVNKIFVIIVVFF